MDSTAIVNRILAAYGPPSDAFNRLVGEMRAIDARKVRLVNLDVSATACRALGVAPKVRALRAEIAASAPCIDLSQLDKLDDYARALQEAHVRCAATRCKSDQLRVLGEEAVVMRSRLRSDIEPLVRRGLIDKTRLVACKGASGYMNVAIELKICVVVLRDAWSQIHGNCCITEAELERAQGVADVLLASVEDRGRLLPAKTEAVDLRARAFTLLVNAYEEARAAVALVRRHHGDAETIAPSLFSGRRRSRKTDDSESAERIDPSKMAIVEPAESPALDEAQPRPAEPAQGKVGSPWHLMMPPPGIVKESGSATTPLGA